MVSNNETDIVPGQVAIVDTKGEPMNEGAKRAGIRRTHADRRDFAQLRHLDELRADIALLTKRINDAIPEAALAVGEKMYEQFSEETSELLEQMEHVITQRVLAEVERRSLRGRIRRAWAPAGDFLHLIGMELGLVSPIPTPPAITVTGSDEAQAP